MQTVPSIEPGAATGKTQELFTVLAQRLGTVPNMLKVMGNSPAILEGYLAFNNAFDKSTLTHAQRGLLTATIAQLTGCDYILSFAYALGGREGLSMEQLNAARRGESVDPKMAAALQFAAAVVRESGRVPASDVRVLQEAGFGDEQIVEVIAFIGISLLRNYFNMVVQTDVDFPLVSSTTQEHRHDTAA